MNTKIGLWIDHRRAVIVPAANTAEDIKVILSHADRQPGRIDGERSTAAFESMQVPADDVKDRRFQQELNTYYDEIIASVHEAEALLIFGPGEAKGEFRKRLEKTKPGGRTVAVETTDKLTDRQIAAKVREHFQTEHPVILL